VSAVPLGLLLRGISSVSPRASGLVPPDDRIIEGVEHDSRQVRPGSLFVCLRGRTSDGHAYARSAIDSGATLVLGELDLDLSPYVKVDDSRKALALLSSTFYGHPSRSLRLVGVTGTNGKTSFCWMLDSVFAQAGLPSAVLGTLGAGTPGDPVRGGAPFHELGYTTPEANVLQEELARWTRYGVEAGAMEVSSHALASRRSYGTRFAAMVFTNLSPDHLDFHVTMEEYRRAKNLAFRRTERGPEEPPAVAVVNADDPAVEGILDGSEDRVVRFGRGAACDVRLGGLVMDASGIRMQVAFGSGATPGPRQALLPTGKAEIVSPLLGEFQVENLLAAFAWTMRTPRMPCGAPFPA
jgi:UDP-N-acetylmuramoyl-L-alanyl-D-glutamate--2,6-diaminopimelate ligase